MCKFPTRTNFAIDDFAGPIQQFLSASYQLVATFNSFLSSIARLAGWMGIAICSRTLIFERVVKFLRKLQNSLGIRLNAEYFCD
jgi:hypothetical protein